MHKLQSIFLAASFTLVVSVGAVGPQLKDFER